MSALLLILQGMSLIPQSEKLQSIVSECLEHQGWSLEWCLVFCKEWGGMNSIACVHSDKQIPVLLCDPLIQETLSSPDTLSSPCRLSDRLSKDRRRRAIEKDTWYWLLVSTLTPSEDMDAHPCAHIYTHTPHTYKNQNYHHKNLGCSCDG